MYGGDASTAFAGQVLIGIGCAPIFTGSMLFIGRRYDPSKFAYFTALVIALGSLGDLLGTMPLALLTEWLGWRYALSGAMLLAALASRCGRWSRWDYLALTIHY